jgi:hypothetical protein
MRAIELISLSLTAEIMEIYSKNNLFRNLPSIIFNKNRKKR